MMVLVNVVSKSEHPKERYELFVNVVAGGTGQFVIVLDRVTYEQVRPGQTLKYKLVELP